jgi:hypothetical protein
MIQTIENQRDEIFNIKEGPHSPTVKSSNENTPNPQKKYPQVVEKISLPKIRPKIDVNAFCKTIDNNKPVNNKSTGENIAMNGISSSQNSIKEQNNKKDFIEKKRRRRNKCSYSYNRNRKSKKRSTNNQINQSGSKAMINIDLIYENINKNKSPTNELDEFKENQDKTVIEIGNKPQKENNQNNKKKSKIDEKELIARAEKTLKERINKEYSDEQYIKDLDMNLKEKRAQFMKEHFPIMYTKDKYYLYTVLLKNRRMQPINFIQPNSLSQMIQDSQRLQTLYLNEELEPPENISSENSDDDKIQKTKNKNIQTSKNNRSNQKSQIKNKSKQSTYVEIIPSFNQIINNSNKSKKEVEQIKQNLTDPKQPIQENNKKYGGGLSDTSPSEHDVKNSDLHLMYEIEEQNELNNNGIKFKKTYNLLPKKVWSFPKNDSNLDIEKFYDDCIQIWPFTECIFVKEIALEFLMKNNYSTTICLKRIKDFVSFMKKRAEELNISILNKNEKTVKKYSLRKSKNN